MKSRNTPLFIGLSIIATAIVVLILWSSFNLFTVEAKTPPYATQFGAMPKPENFIIHLPWAFGGSDLGFRVYGDVSHTGKDFFAVDFDINGSMVHPTASGKIIYTKNDPNCSECYGNYVVIEHTPNFPNYISVYAHLADILVSQNDLVDVNTPLGHEGSTGTDTQHLHFALMYCTNIQIGQFPTNCSPVVPEPILGREVYEGLDWWHELNPSTPVIAESRPPQDSSLPSGNWDSDSTGDGESITYGESVVFHIHYSDESQIGEVRLTAYYPNWPEQHDPELAGLYPEQIWRILARCKPEVGGCGGNEWRFEWFPHMGDNGFPNLSGGLLDVPWLPKANPPIIPDSTLELCISFDIFDRTGNPYYSPGDPRCNFNNLSFPGTDQLAPTGNEARLIYIEPISNGMPTPDDADFRADITLSDGTVVSPNQPLLKTWRLQNIGTTTWGSGYQLVFINGDQMSGPGAVDVPETGPGQEVDISVNLTAPSSEGDFTGYWRLRNPQGTYFGPTIWVNLVVPGSNPPPPTTNYEIHCMDCPAIVPPGYIFRPTVQVRVGSGQLLESRGDMLRNTDGNLYGAWPHVAVQGVVNTGQTYNFVFYENNPITAPTTEGTYQTKWRLWQDGQYVGDELTITFQVQQGSGENHPPNAPTLTGPGDWAVYYGNTGIVLSAQENGDPDGDPVLEYYFEIFESAQNANSGWITSNSWSPQGLGFNGYQWHVKVRDSRGAESGWSNTWHFNIINNITQIYSFSAVSCWDEWGGPEKLCFCADTNAGTLKVQVNDATDGSGNGEWHIINELGVPDYQCDSPDDNPPNWNQLEGESGTHLVRLYARGEGGWENAATADITVYLPPERRPNNPPNLLPTWESFLNTLQINFSWEDSLRTDNYQLQVSELSDFSNLLVDQTLSLGITGYDYTLASAYDTVYWRVIANGPYGSNTSEGRFHPDIVPPTTNMSVLPPVTTDTVFSVNWSGSDDRSGLRWYHLQVKDGDHPTSQWVDWLVNTTKTAELYVGLPGHTYYFRARAMDEVGNWEAWPVDQIGDTFTLIDPSAVPPTNWWDDAYSWKRNLIVLNNDADTMPVQFPIHIHFDSSTEPTSEEIYNASVSAIKGDDVRVIYNNQVELPRFVQYFNSSQIDLWFPLYAPLGGGQTDNSSYQVYYGNSSASVPPADVVQVFSPPLDGNTMGLWHFQEANGGTVYDQSGRAHHGIFYNADWGDGYLGYAGYFNGANSYVEIGHSDDFRPGAITLEAWIYVNGSMGDYPMIFNKDRYWLRLTGGGNLQFMIKADGGDRYANGSTNLQLYQWYHIAATYDGGTEMRVFVNGYQDGYSNTGAPPVLWNDQPMRIGRTDYSGNSYFPGYIQHARISNIARTSFPYGQINIPPGVASGSLITPPGVGAPDLTILSMQTYPSLSGGVFVQAVVQNEGTMDLLNGFYTDLYVNNLPTGTGDYTGSIQLWINDPIPAGAILTFTTVIDDLNLLFGNTPLTPASESTSILYAQTDSAGVVAEDDETNNIFENGLQVCVASPDAFEGDDNYSTATFLGSTDVQEHNFSYPGDEDWVKFVAIEGETYPLNTYGLGNAADTYLYLYDTDGTTLLASNDDSGGSLASRIDWVAPASGTYYIKIVHWNPNVSGCGTKYFFSMQLPKVYLPIIVR